MKSIPRGGDSESMFLRQRNDDRIGCRFKENEGIHDSSIKIGFNVPYIYNFSKGARARPLWIEE